MSETYNLWTVIQPSTYKLGFVEARCACGTEKEVNYSNLKKGLSKSCGCLPRATKSVIGKVYNRLTIISEPVGSGNSRKVIALCSCGVEKEYGLYAVTSGNTTSCGCYKLEKISSHGLTGTKTYKAWANAISRTTNPKVPGYKDYGRRGIKVSQDWLTFENFLRDMGEAPEGLSLERMDNDGDYCKGNCRWATKAEQSRNKDRVGSKKLGVVPNGKGKWIVQIGLRHSNGKQYNKYLGTFSNYHEAVACRVAAEKLYWSNENDNAGKTESDLQPGPSDTSSYAVETGESLSIGGSVST